jgi:hypothetical protein
VKWAFILASLLLLFLLASLPPEKHARPPIICLGDAYEMPGYAACWLYPPAGNGPFYWRYGTSITAAGVKYTLDR